jgi:hypothetical protein
MRLGFGNGRRRRIHAFDAVPLLDGSLEAVEKVHVWRLCFESLHLLCLGLARDEIGARAEEEEWLVDDRNLIKETQMSKTR